ncbi:hypothetical protein DMTZ50_1460 [Dehalococcoides mccartyi]|nr:hypothetical protein [Dehalococcoides mccartyi]
MQMSSYYICIYEDQEWSNFASIKDASPYGCIQITPPPFMV